MLRLRLHAAATAVVMWPLQALNHFITTWQRPTALVRQVAAEAQAIATAEDLVHDLYETWYAAPDTEPHVTT